MKTNQTGPGTRSGLTLIEMTMVLLMLMTLIGAGVFSSRKIGEWQRGKEASSALQTVWSAQRMFLADNPTRLPSSLTATEIAPYLPNGATSVPTVTSLTNTQLAIMVNRFPPVVNNGSGGVYDPSGSSTDELWDVGKPQ
jgi:type II secretory pathway pseudopilin PulG